MPAPACLSHRPALAFLGLASLAVLLTARLSRPAGEESAPPHLLGASAWTVADLLRHLEGRGLHLHAAGTRENGPVATNAFLSLERRPWADLGGLVKDPSRFRGWSGIVYCEYGAREGAREGALAGWGEWGLRAGPFVFFGDPNLLAQIRDALASPP